MVKFIDEEIIVDVNNKFILNDEDDAYMYYWNNFAKNNKINTEKIYKHILEKANWHQPNVKMHGKEVLYPRMCASICDMKEYDEKYKNIIDTPIDWTPEMTKLKNKIEKFLMKINPKWKFNYCQMNYYKDNNQYIGLHRDRETKKNEIICSFSLGVTRKFIFEEHKSVRKDKKESPRYTLDLKDGDLCVMSYGACGPKSKWKHGVLKSKNTDNTGYSNGGRIVITFRQN